MPDIPVCQAAFGTTPHPGSKPVVCLTAPGSLQPAVSCNQRGHDPDDCDPSGSLYGLIRNDCGSGPSDLVQSFWARPSDDCDPNRRWLRFATITDLAKCCQQIAVCVDFDAHHPDLRRYL